MDALSAAAALLPDLRVEAAETLRRSERSEVLRVRVDGPGWPGPPTLIVKLCPDAGESWARETAALTVMPGTAPVPRLIAAGHTNAKIARQLGITEGTVRSHLEDIYARLQVSNRAAAVARAFPAGAPIQLTPR